MAAPPTTIAGPWLVSADGSLEPGPAPTTCTHAEAAELLGLARSTIATMAARGTLPSEDGKLLLAGVLARRTRSTSSAET